MNFEKLLRKNIYRSSQCLLNGLTGYLIDTSEICHQACLAQIPIARLECIGRYARVEINGSICGMFDDQSYKIFDKCGKII